jgi:endonuclease YncB( thermonuclease family)
MSNILSIFYKTKQISKMFVWIRRHIPESSYYLTCSCLSTKPVVTKAATIPENIEWKDTTLFLPPITSGRVIKVYDGDTITIAAKLPYDDSPLYRFPVRLNGIDAPEIRGKDEDEKLAAQNAKCALENLILNKIVTLKNNGPEKYGRILADVYYEDLHLNDWMLKNHYAIPYDGGTKKSPKSWLTFNKTGNLHFIDHNKNELTN